MTDELKAKLREILRDCVNKAYGTMDSKSWHDPYPEPITQIYQVFKEAGYRLIRNVQQGRMMTGQEFYERFEKEANNYPLANTVDRDNQAWRCDDVLEAAKRAAGIDHD